MSRILVVEDNPQSMKLASLLLRKNGHDVVPAISAEVADEALLECLPDLILMDLGLPGKDGYTLTRELRKRPSVSDIPILAVSAFAMKGDEERALEAGCSSYLSKPIHASIFIKRINELLALRSLATAGAPGTSEEPGQLQRGARQSEGNQAGQMNRLQSPQPRGRDP